MNPPAPGRQRPVSRALVLVLSAVLLVLAPSFALPAAAHEPPTVELSSPIEGGIVTGTQVNIVLVGKGGTGTVSFEVLLDGEKVSADGKVGADATFTTHTLAPGQQSMVVITTLKPGSHELRIVHQKHADAAPRADIVRRFGSRPVISVEKQRKEATESSRGAMLIAIGSLVALGGIFWLVEKLRGREQNA